MILVYPKFKCKWYYLLAFLIFATSILSAQTDTIKNKNAQFFLSDDLIGDHDNSTIDSGLTRFQIVVPYFNDYTTTWGYLGNVGSALRSNYFGFTDDLNFHYRQDYFEKYKFTDCPISFDKKRDIHTNISFYTGSKKEQIFGFAHSQRLSKNFAAGIDFRSIVSPSFYKREFADAKVFDLYVIFETTNHKYSAYVDYISGKINNNENGGIVSDSAVENATGINKKTVPVNLDNAQWLAKNKTLVIKQQYNFKSKTSFELAEKDTNIKSTQITHPITFLHYDFSYKTYSELFTSPNDSAFWPINYYDSLTTNDTANNYQFLNSIYFQTGFKGINLRLGVNNQYMSYKMMELDSLAQRTGIFVGGDANITNHIFASLGYEQTVSGTDKNTYLFKVGARYVFENKKIGSFNLNYFNARQNQFLVSNTLRTNHFLWNNNFKNIDRNVITVSLTNPLFTLGVRYNNINNYVYYDTLLKPIQLNAAAGYTDVYLNLNLKYNKWHLNNTFDFVADKSIAVNLPTINFHSSLFFESYAFNNALFSQIGIDLFYNSAYRADGFMPELQQFYTQEDIKIGNYPFIDFFVSGRIKTVKFFLKLENIGAGIIGNNYFSATHYPLPIRMFRLGISWSFYN